MSSPVAPDANASHAEPVTKTPLRHAFNSKSISAGVVAALFGCTGPALVIINAAEAGGLTNGQTVAWLFAVYVLGGPDQPFHGAALSSADLRCLHHSRRSDPGRFAQCHSLQRGYRGLHHERPASADPRCHRVDRPVNALATDADRDGDDRRCADPLRHRCGGLGCHRAPSSQEPRR